MRDQMFITPAVVVDGSELAFVGAIEPGREAEAFATLLTFATFAEKTEQVVDEAYSAECARTGTTVRLGEERWYQVAKQYFDEFVDSLQNATPEVLLGHYLWLEKHFFNKHRGYDPLRGVIRHLLTRQAPGMRAAPSALLH